MPRLQFQPNCFVIALLFLLMLRPHSSELICQSWESARLIPCPLNTSAGVQQHLIVQWSTALWLSSRVPPFPPMPI